MARPGQTPDLLGVWLSPPGRPPGAPAAGVALVSWQVDLPRQSAGTYLGSSQRLLEGAGLALPQAELRLQAQIEQARRAPAGQAFAAPWKDWADLPAEAAEAARFFDAMRLALAPTARVQTTLDGQVVGLTDIAWNGSFTNRLPARLNPRQAARHAQVVRQVLASRQAVLRMGVLVAAGAASLAAGALSGPFSLLFVYQFVRQIVAEFQSLPAG